MNVETAPLPSLFDELAMYAREHFGVELTRAKTSRAARQFVLSGVFQLIADGWAHWVGDESEGRSRPIELTPAAFDRMREKGWVSG